MLLLYLASRCKSGMNDHLALFISHKGVQTAPLLAEQDMLKIR